MRKVKNNRIKKDYKRGLGHRIRSRGIDQMSDVEIRIVFYRLCKVVYFLR